MTEKIVVNVDGKDFELPSFEALKAVLVGARAINDTQDKEKDE
jgi:hypothetical protein